ncbi:hypothetical protein DAPPUDRAFT_241409 [Daphnia pulex]|uniref:Uncharacterized protein n=1 Tax=Daphnia pulex TaxID=6669 RepID=E9GE72_DAPPU|nr:hypothetical protein DAPPUDRAFT_241409 [Daphnia pulex]|eukprot:EFX82363.1 hypothetical protein DAPPUDRAFT_241409 [Daphnia pulex]
MYATLRWQFDADQVIVTTRYASFAWAGSVITATISIINWNLEVLIGEITHVHRPLCRAVFCRVRIFCNSLAALTESLYANVSTKNVNMRDHVIDQLTTTTH